MNLGVKLLLYHFLLLVQDYKILQNHYQQNLLRAGDPHKGDLPGRHQARRLNALQVSPVRGHEHAAAHAHRLR